MCHAEVSPSNSSQVIMDAMLSVYGGTVKYVVPGESALLEYQIEVSSSSDVHVNCQITPETPFTRHPTIRQHVALFGISGRAYGFKLGTP